MKKKTPIEMERDRIAKITRSMLRLKYSLKADEAINDILPETLDQFDTAIQAGELKSLYAGLSDLLESD